MSEAERLALQVLMPGFEGLEPPAWLLEQASELGSVCLYSRNVSDDAQVAALTARLHELAPDLLIAVDEEGGDVTRLEAGPGSSFPGNLALGKAGDGALTEAVAAALGARLNGLGIDLDLAPVADVNSNPDNPVIGVRSFGADAEQVAVHTAAFVRGLQSQGVAACAKHFPGHGDTRVDSHLDLPEVAATQLSPFQAAVAAGVKAVMSAHIVVAGYGPAPATLNPGLVRLLREDLGFEGLLISDGIEMRALTARMGLAEAAVAALQAGVDLVCIGGGHTGAETVAELKRAIAASVSIDRLREAAARVQGLTRWRREQPPPSAAGSSIGLEAARRALDVQGDVRLGPAAVIVELEGGRSIAIGAHRPRLTASSLYWTAADVDVRELLERARGRDLAVVVRDPHRLAWQRDVLDRVLAARPDAVVVDLGFPVLAPPARGLLRTFGAARVNRQAALERLSGRSPEEVHPAAADVPRLATADLLSLMHQEDLSAVHAVGERLAEIATAADAIAERLRAGGRWHYFGAGTSGRLAALDAYECPATFGVAEELVSAHLAPDGAGEDAAELGVEEAARLTAVDALVGVTASGETPYVLAALRTARERGALTVAITAAAGTSALAAAEIAVAVPTGPEVVAGSTRLKAGTAQKLVLNMLSTAVFTRLGRTYRGRMVDLVVANEKLRRRAVRLVSELSGASATAAQSALEASGWSSRTALASLGVDLDGVTVG